jgi:hypothetical protein
MNTPVLFLVFNRPDTTRMVFEAIRNARPSRLYVAADGPRRNVPSDIDNCETTRTVATQVDWPSDLKTLFRTSNLGCKVGVATAIDWFFENEEEGIILEDDVVPVAGFFPYCEELLNRYRLDQRVSLISGHNLAGTQQSPYSYVFSNYQHIWGWASWRRAWADYDMEMKEWPSWRDGGGLNRISARDPPFNSYWRHVFDTTHRGAIDTWDYQWQFANWRLGRLAILPRASLIQNVGFRSDATHTKEPEPAHLRALGSQELTFPLVHPPQLAPSPQVEAMIGRTFFGITWRRYWFLQLKRLPILGPAVARVHKMLRKATP